MKLSENKGRFSVTIPKDIIDRKGWQKGQKLFVNYNERGNVEVQALE